MEGSQRGDPATSFRPLPSPADSPLPSIRTFVQLRFLFSFDVGLVFYFWLE